MNIVKRIFIGVSIAMIVWFLKSEVFAMSVTSRLQYTDNNTVVDTSYVSDGTLMSFTTSNNNHEFFFTRVFVRFTDSFTSGSTYRFEYNYNISAYQREFYNHMCPDNLTVSSGTISSSSCSFNGATVSIVVTWQSTSNVSYVTFGSAYGVMLLNNTTYNFRTLTDWLWSEVDSTQEAVNNNTAVISNALAGISSILNNIYDQQEEQVGFAQALVNVFSSVFDSSEEYLSNSYSYSSTNVIGYSSAHNSGTSAGGSGSGSGGSGSLSFDYTNYSGSSSTIWDFVYRFLSLNSKLLTYLTSILTLGFVKVVLNR